MSSENPNREVLEKLFPKPFTDYQWGLIVSQGYEAALASGRRSAQEVAQELKDLIEAAGRRATAGSDHQVESALTWDEMEKLVLGRILTTGETSGPKVTPGSPGSGARARRLAEGRQRGRRVLWIALWSGLAMLAIAAAGLLLFWGPQCEVSAGPSASTSTSEAGQQDALAGDLVGRPTTTVSKQPPATIPALQVPEYTAELSGANEVPAIKTAATGTLELDLSEDGLKMDYVLAVKSLTGLTFARLRVGAAGVNGEEIVTLYSGPTKKDLFSGVAADWSFSAADFVGQLKGKTMTDFIALVDAGSVYVNVGTTKNRDGEIRGQLE